MLPYESVALNLCEAMKVYSHATPQGLVQEYPGMSLVCSGLHMGMFNAALLAGPVIGEQDLERRAMLARLFYEQRRVPWSFWVCDDLLDQGTRRRSRRFFAHQGMQPVSEPTGMSAAVLTVPRPGLPPVECRPVTDEATRQAFCRITGLAFDLSFASSWQIYGDAAVWGPDYRGYVGYLQGEPVSTVAVVPAAQSLGLYSVATLPQFQRKRLAEALLRQVIPTVQKETGVWRVILQSTRMGLHLYERLGFQAVTRLTVYLAS